MSSFNTIGYRVCEDSLKVRMTITQEKKDEANQVKHKKDKIIV